MTPSGTAWFGHLRPLGFCTKMAVLAGALGLSFLPVAVIAFTIHGNAGIVAASIACFACLMAGLNGLGIATLFSKQFSATPIIAGTLVRMGLPLLLVLALVITSHPLLNSGFAYYLIAFYQVMLFIELMLIVPSSVMPTNAANKNNGFNSHGG